MSAPKFCLLTLMIAVPAILRLVDVGWNAVPIGAVALFAGATFRHRSLAFAVPICAMLISDFILGWHRNDFQFYTFHPLMPVVYACYAASVCLGFGIRRRWNKLDEMQSAGEHSTAESATAENDLFSQRTVATTFQRFFKRLGTLASGILSQRMLPVALGTLGGALLFFFATNFGDWLVYYQHSWAGLADCFTKALPFFRNTLMADVFGAVVLFGGYEIVCRRAAVADPTGLLHAR